MLWRRDIKGGGLAVRQAVGGGCQNGYGRLQMPLRLALGVRGTVAGHRLGALEGGGGGGVTSNPSNASLGGGQGEGQNQLFSSEGLERGTQG